MSFNVTEMFDDMNHNLKSQGRDMLTYHVGQELSERVSLVSTRFYSNVI